MTDAAMANANGPRASAANANAANANGPRASAANANAASGPNANGEARFPSCADGETAENTRSHPSPEVFDFRKPPSGDATQGVFHELSRPVFFVGFMGAGKTSVARKLARNAGVAAIDMDTYIERRCDKKVKEIFAESGEAGFRAIETDLLRELALGEPRLVSCGGGVVLARENRDILREHGFVVYLKVTAAEAASRISDVSTRPLFGDLEQAQRVIEGRLPLYEEVADVEIDTAGRGTGSIAREAFGLLKKEGVLIACQRA